MTTFAPKCLCLDIETAAENPGELYKLAAWRPDTGASLSLKGRFPADWPEKLDALSDGAAFVVGHNIWRHDLPVLHRLHPRLKLLGLPVVDTLELSPIAFPQNPYHSLVKDYKLVRDARNDPLKDAQLALKLWRDQFEALRLLQQAAPEELACHHYLLTRDAASGIGSFFATLRRAVAPGPEEAALFIRRVTAGKVCAAQLEPVLAEALADEQKAKALAYVLAWLRVSGGNSVVPPWVRSQYPAVRRFVRQLRETHCGDPRCAYCATFLDPRKELERYFGFPAFRPGPAGAGGVSLQEEIVRAAYAGRPHLAILPTGGGKSICYQLPALSRHWRTGSLTIVVSPLQSLMKDQVDNLVKAGIQSAATLNGLLTMPERRDVLERVRLGDVGILLVSPEQFRNRGFVDAIRHREIGAWVFDEAHCLSKWGNDFRPDYLYVSRFIREKYGNQAEVPLAPVCCFTATAKREVVDDLRQHFREALGIELEVFDGGHERPNLHYEVIQVTKQEKMGLIHRLLETELGPADKAEAAGGAVVFASSRKSAEEFAAYLRDMGWACAYFHAGLEPGRKKEIQRDFIAGNLRAIVATNAFGMGVDKPDVRLVVHAEIPGSLENYLQEAGRAGRDRKDSRCVLLYDEEDIERQFSLAAQSRLSRKDIAGILTALRRYSARTRSSEIVLTPGEILADEELDTAIDPHNPDADTRVTTAIAWLERARFLERNENHTRVFPGSLRVGSVEEAEAQLRRANLSEEMRGKYQELVLRLMNARDDEGISTDELMLHLGVSAEECMRMLHQLERLGVVSNDLALTVLLRKGIKDSSADRLGHVARMERALLELLPELAPDAAPGEWQDMNLRAVCQELNTRTDAGFLPDQLMTLMHSLARSFGDEAGASRRALFDVRLHRREILRVRLLRDWGNIRQIADKRRQVAGVLLTTLLERVAPGLRGADLRVECKLGELSAALRSDLAVGPALKDEAAAIHAGLLYLHDNGVLILDRGKSVFRKAMTIRVFPEERRGFGATDFEPLRAHYAEKNFQIHVMHEYARLGLKKVAEALSFVLAYFTLPKLEFIRRYFAGRREMLERATTEESYRRIVGDLRHPVQQRLVAERPDVNRLILAGPGSGKTRVIVHRVAYLVRVLREPPGSILVLAFNRSAAWEVRARLRALLGQDAGTVTVLTYHALALRLTGTSLAASEQQGEEPDFERILDEALALLEGRKEISGLDADPHALRSRLLAGYRYILVDEYQDIDERQYRLISALAGRQLEDPDAKLTLMAVGDDDQNIYAFRGTRNEFIRRFQEDYRAKVEYLVENFRSSAHIIAAANEVISACADRLKAGHPIRINHARRNDAPGGRWQKLDALGQGRVQILAVPEDAIGQAVVAMDEVRRLKSLDAGADWSDFAVLARTHVQLAPVKAWCALHGVAILELAGERAGLPRLHQTREAWALLSCLGRKPRRRLRPGAASRWYRMRFAGGHPDNPWQALLRQFIEELDATWGDTEIPAAVVMEALHEFGNEARRTERGRLVVSTVHGAKGREFKHVVMLDGGWREACDEERRLCYVGMTRAKETLTLCERRHAPNPFTRGLGAAPFLLRIAPGGAIQRCEELGWQTVTLGLKDVDLGFAGRLGDAHPVHRALARLGHGDSLELVCTDKGRELRLPGGIAVGRLARACQLPPGRVLAARVHCLVRRTREQSRGGDYADSIRTDAWWVVLPEITLAPEERCAGMARHQVPAT